MMRQIKSSALRNRGLIRLLVLVSAVGMLTQQADADQSSPGFNILPNAGFTTVQSGYWPDWWNWYNALGNKNINLEKSLRLSDEHYIPGTRSMKLAYGGRVQTSYLRVYFQKDTTFTFSAYLRASRPNTKVEMYIGGSEPFNKEKQVAVGTDWKRYHVTGTTTTRMAKPSVIVSLVGDGPVWVNAPQLEEGDTPTPWKLSLRDTTKDPGAEPPAEPKFAMPKIDCLKVDTAPTIDGVLDDKAWTLAAATSRFMRLDEDKPAEVPTDAYICRDDEAVYVAFRCHEPEMDKLTAETTLFDSTRVFREDCVEVFISGNEDGSDYLRFAASAIGTKVDSKGFTKFFDTQWQCAASRSDDFWSVEFRLPFESLERPLQPGSPWRLNLARFRARPKTEEYSAWAPVIRGFHDSEHFGFVYGIIAQVSRRSKQQAPSEKLIAYLDRSFYTQEESARLYIKATKGTDVRYTFQGVEHQARLPETGLVPVDLSTLSVGTHPLAVAVGAQQVDLVVKKLAPKAHAVKIDQLNRIFMIDDEPFMPFASSGEIKKLKDQADLGFKSTYIVFHQPFDEKGRAMLQRTLDKAQDVGLKAMVWYSNHQLIEDHAAWEAELLRIVEAFKDHPALLAWWVFDEPVSGIKWLKGLCASVNKTDPYHPVFVNWCDRGHGWTADMGDVTGQVNMLDGYYLNAYGYSPREAFEMIGGHCAQMTADARRRGNVVGYINGIHGWTSAIREPSPEENRFLTYTSLIRGARILLYYNWGPPANPALTQSFRSLAGEMQTLTSIVSNPQVTESVSCDNQQIAYTAFDTPDGLYIVALNTDKNDEEATFRFGGACGSASVLFEDRQLQVEDGALKDQFAPIERHVYRVAPTSGR